MSDVWKTYVDHPERNPFSMKFTTFKSRMRITSIYKGSIPDWFMPGLKDNTLLRQIMWRREKGMNCFVAVLGNVRSGKSYFCLRFAELYSKYSGKEFNVKEQVSFCDIPHFLRWSSTATDSVYVLDEVQLGMSPRRWYSLQNRIMNQFCDIQGLRRNLLLFPLPNISYIDKHLRFLLNYVCRTLHQGVLLWWRVNTRHELGKTWLDSMGSIKFQLPTQKTIEEYEELKKVFTDQHLQDSIDLIELAGKPDEKIKLDMEYKRLRNKRIKQQLQFKDQIMNERKELERYG